MPETDTISLRQMSSSNEQEPHDSGQTSRQREFDRKRIMTLVGSAISQMPIWGFAMSYGVLQQYYFDNWTFQGARELTGIIGTTSNGVMYISMPFTFALFTKRWARHRRAAAVCGVMIACINFILSAFSKSVWHLIITQGVLAALGCALAFSPLTLSLGEWFNTENRICNRAVAYGICLSTKNIVGACCPFVFRGLLDWNGFRMTMIVWACIMVSTGIVSIFMIPTPPSATVAGTPRGRNIPWHFLKYRTFWMHSTATLLQSAGYGIPLTYLSEYARNISAFSPTVSTLLLTVISIPGICSSTFFGFLSDNKYFHLSALTVTAISAISSAIAAFIFWGLAARGDVVLLILFAITFGFFASGYSATWGAIMIDMEREAALKNEAIDSGVLYGLLNGARGIGYVSGGLISVPLIKAGSTSSTSHFGYGTTYGPLIIFTGLSLAFGGWGIAFRPPWRNLLQLR